MGDDIEQLKTVFRSLVVSSPTQVNVRSLLRDYRNMIGAPVPLTKYGYRNPVEFLKERFSDCFLFSGDLANPVLTLIVPSTLKHIDKFVQKQKVSSTAKFNPKRRSVPEESVKPLKEKFDKFLIDNNFKSTETPKKICEQLNITVSKPREVVTKPAIVPSKVNHNDVADQINSYNNLAYKTNIVSKPENISNLKDRSVDIDYKIKNTHSTENKHIDNKIENTASDNCNAVKIFFKKRLPQYNSSHYLDEESNSLASPDKSIRDDDSGRHTSSSGNSGKAQQLEQLKMEIMELICDAPDGVWCTDLIRLYRERYKRELNFTRFGFTSILSLVYSVERRVQVTRPDATGDWLLQERARAAAASAPAPPALRARRARAPRAAPRAAPAPDSDDALPGIDFDPDVFPEDCVHFMESIDSVSLSDFRPGAMVEVLIGEVYSPSHFWFIRAGEHYNMAMEDMMDEMTQYYNNEGSSRALARGAVRVGHYCAALYERDWHRALIVRVVDSETVKVRHVDYGTVDTVAVSALKPLRRQWASLPAQAARARLAAVRPPAAGWRWPHAACTAFLALVTDRRLVANVVALDERDRLAEVLLIDTSSEEDVCIGSELIRAGHADSRPDSALRTLDVYLYPRFEALEGGATPNYAEIHAYLRDGIALDYVDSYRAHVPHVLPAAPEPPAQPELRTTAAPPPPPPPSPPPPPKPKPAPTLSEPAPRPPGTALAPHSASHPPRPHDLDRTPPPPYGGPPPPPPPPLLAMPTGVTLSLAECETYRVLSHVNPAAAHWFMVGAMGRAMSVPVGQRAPQPLYPAYAMEAPSPVCMPLLRPPGPRAAVPGPNPQHVSIRPPPGFGY